MTLDLSLADMRRILDEATGFIATEQREVPLPCIEGEVPRSLQGVFYRNGPGRLERGGQRYAHPFDGDGHVVRLAIREGTVHYTNRFVRTPEFLAEETAGHLLYRGFGTNRPGGWWANVLRLRIKNPANTSVVWHGGRLLALWEGGPPYRLHPRTLETLGVEDFAGRLRNPLTPLDRALVPLLPFSAHPWIDPVTGELLNFGVLFARPSRLMLYRVNAAGEMAPPVAHRLERYRFIHDFGVTARYLVFLVPPLTLRLHRAWLGFGTPIDSFHSDPRAPLEVLLIPRDGTESRRFPTLPGFVFHLAQAFDRPDGRLVLDFARYPGLPPFDRFDRLFAPAGPLGVAQLERLTLDPDTGAWDCQPLAPHPAEFPRSVPRSTDSGTSERVLFTLTAPAGRRVPFYNQLQRLDPRSGARKLLDCGADLPGEPVVVPDPAAMDGAAWILTLVYRAELQRTDLVILRATDLGFVARLPLPGRLPLGFHGCWAAALE